MISIGISRRAFVLIAAVIGALAVGSGLFYSPNSIAAPGVTWTPAALNREIGFGESVPVTVTFVASEKLTNIRVRIVPALQPLLVVSPSTISSIQKGVPITVTITMAAPSSAPIGTTSGTIHLLSGSSTVSRPLPLSVTYRGSLPPDPGEAGNLTIAGIDSNANGVRDDVERWIGFNVRDSARKQTNLMLHAAATQEGLLSTTRDEAIAAANESGLAISCFAYLGIPQNQRRWREALAVALNTEARIRAYDDYQDRISGEVFGMLPRDQLRSACRFDVETLPN